MRGETEIIFENRTNLRLRLKLNVMFMRLYCVSQIYHVHIVFSGSEVRQKMAFNTYLCISAARSYFKIKQK